MPQLDMDLLDFRRELADALTQGGTQSFTRLTDEELAVLDPVPHEESIVSAPHLSAMKPEQREWVMATALRSLVAREIVEITNIGELDDVLRGPGGGSKVDVDMRILPEVDLVLTLRRTPDRVLAVRQETAAGTAYAYVYIHAPDLLLVERVTAGGMHLFTLAGTVTDVAALLQPLTDPFGLADRDGPEAELDPHHLDHEGVGPLGEVIDSAKVVGHFVLLADTPGPMMMTYATDTAVWAVIVESPHAPTGIIAQQVGAKTLARLITDLLS